MICRELQANNLITIRERKTIKMKILQDPKRAKLAVDLYLKTGKITSFRDKICGEVGLPRLVISRENIVT